MTAAYILSGSCLLPKTLKYLNPMYSIPYVLEKTSAYSSSTYLVRAYGDNGLPTWSSTFGSSLLSPYVELLAANMNLLTLESRAATNIFKKPPTLTSFVVIGSLILLGILPKAAS